MRLLVIIPAYNEEENIVPVVDYLKRIIRSLTTLLSTMEAGIIRQIFVGKMGTDWSICR